jgi:hypothetical protein
MFCLADDHEFEGGDTDGPWLNKIGRLKLREDDRGMR